MTSLAARHISLLPLLLLLAACGDGRDCVDGSGNITSEIRQVPVFTEIELAGSISMVISPGDSISVRVEGDDNLLENVDTEVDGNRLVAGYDGCFDTDSAIVVYVSVPELRRIQLSGSGNIASSGMLHVSSLIIRNNGSGSIDLNVTTSTLRTASTGSGSIALSGRATSHESLFNGSGELNAAGLATDRTTVTSNGSGQMFVNATRRLTANLSGSGDLHYSGSPASISINASGSGTAEAITD